jgi:hypothetical protein
MECLVASTPPPFTIEALDAEATGARVVFEWRDDRYHHAIYGVSLGENLLLAESVEDDCDSSWPPSPPLQQLHKQPGGTGGEVLLGTGMAGKSHWSGSVATSIDQRWTEVTFEFACRHRTTPDWLGVTYRLGPNVHAEQPGDSDSVVLTIGAPLKYSIHAAAVPVSIATEFIPTASILLDDRTLRIAAKPTAHMTTATTNRWAYAVQLTRPYWLRRVSEGEN